RMEDTPEVRFADANGSSIAFQAYGQGPPTICAVPPMAQNIELAWESPVMRRMFTRYGAFSRQVVFDKRGTGMSDRSLDLPGLDERVDELRAVMDAAGVGHAFLHGVSEGGPMAIMFAATYPDRVDGLILEGSAASLLTDTERARRRTPEGLATARARWHEFVEAWGTPHSRTVGLFAPSLLAEEDFVRWWPRYERHAASRDALMDLFRTNGDMDARDVIPRVRCPVLVIHRTHDPVIPIDRAHETVRLFARAGVDVRLAELPGGDHFSFAGDLDAVADAIEGFTTGTVVTRQSRVARPAVEIDVLGGFEVRLDGVAVPVGEWGSRRARTLLKRLVVARGGPVTRDELCDLLWPDDLSDRVSARLSVQLSAVRRILHGGVIADRSTVRLDLAAVAVDLERWFALTDDDTIVRTWAELLPEDRYEDWSQPRRQQVADRFVAAARRVAGDESPAEAVALLRRVLAIDPYDEVAHRALVAQLRRDGRHGEAAQAQRRYEDAMAELA
ncbi:MAG: alpha/beta hydrolase, partial [Actinobacteria bacterium]|nr:alpha/beta hydrolase [Actinomycetota bacterium]